MPEPDPKPPEDGTPDPTPVALVDADGKFSENFKDSLPEEIRGEKILDNLGDFHGAMKQLVHAQKQIGRDKVILPNEKSTENDWNMFFDQIGRPKTAGDYKFIKDESLPEEIYDDILIESFLEGAYKAGFTQKQIDYMNEFENLRLKSGLESIQAQKDKELREVTEALKAKWGAAYDQRLHLANLMVNENSEEGEERDMILSVIGNNPIVADFLANIARKFTEDKAITGSMTTPTPSEAIKEAEKLRATPGYLDGKLFNSNPAKSNEITKKIQELYEVAHKGS